MDQEFWDNLIKNVLESFAIPEANRRQAAGELPDDFTLYAVQVVMEPGVPNEIRFNEEVKLAANLRPGAEITQDGEHPILDFADLAPQIQHVDLLDDDRPNAAHITLVQTSGGWYATFDFRYNSARIAEHILAATEFIEAAQQAFLAKRLRPFCADLFTAVELLAKGRLLLHPDERLLSSKSHNFTSASYHRYANDGNVDPRFPKLLKRLEGLRNSARYPSGTFQLGLEEGSEMLDLANEMLGDLRAHTPMRALRALEDLSNSAGNT